jgi:glutathione S-transferase
VYTLYVIPGSHACRAAQLMLEHKALPYRRNEVPTLLHPVIARLHGFDGGGELRSAGTHRTLPLRIGDWLGTVPGLACDGERISTNYRIARFLDDRHPVPRLLPADAKRRTAVEAAERWANETLQMAARRILLPAALRDPAEFSRLTGDGRLGPLLYHAAVARRLIAPMIARNVFAANARAERGLLGELPALLDRVDDWIREGVLGAPELNVADFMVVPSLALILYRRDLRPLFDGRPALDLVDRVLPDPSG